MTPAGEPPLKPGGAANAAAATVPTAVVITDADLAILPVSSSSESSNAVAAPEPLFAKVGSTQLAAAAGSSPALDVEKTPTADPPATAAAAARSTNTNDQEASTQKRTQVLPGGPQVATRPTKPAAVSNLKLSVVKAAAPSSGPSSASRQSMSSPKLVCRVTGEAFTLKEDRQPVDMPCCGATVCVAAVKQVPILPLPLLLILF